MEPILERLPIQAERCHFEPDGTLPALPAEPAAGGEPPVHHRRGQAHGRRPRHRLGRRRRPLLLHRRHGRVRARRLHHRADGRVDARASTRARRSSTTCAPRGRCPTSSSARAARRSRAASATPSSSTACARRTRSSRARSRATTTSATSTASTPGIVPALRRARARLARRQAARPSCCAPLHERYHLSGEINSTRGRRAAQAAGAEGALRRARRGRPDHAPRRRLGRLRRLALQRAALQHRAAAAPEPRGLLSRRDGAAARRGAGADPLRERRAVRRSDAAARRSASRRGCASASTRPTPRRVVYYGRYLPVLRPRAGRVPAPPGLLHALPAGLEFVMRHVSCEYEAPARFDDEIEVFIRTASIGRTSWRWDMAVHHCESGELLARAEQVMVLIDRAARKPEPVPDAHARRASRRSRAAREHRRARAGDHRRRRGGRRHPARRARRGARGRRRAVERDRVRRGGPDGDRPGDGHRPGRHAGARARDADRLPRRHGRRALARERRRRRSVEVELERAAALLAPYCLVGWDTGGEEWVP